MLAKYIKVENATVEIPIFDPGAFRLFKKPNFKKRRVGAEIGHHGKVPFVRALNEITLELAPGDRLGLVGHNGSGKTSLLRLLCGVYIPSSGQVHVSGSVGAVLDMGVGLIEDLTGYECISLYCKYKQLDQEHSAAVLADIEEFAELGEFLSLPVRTYSAGMRSRLAAGLQTSLTYDILLVDEGIGAGDAAFQAKFQERVNAFLETAPILVMASHSADLLRQYCNRGVVMQRGSIVFTGSIDEAQEQYASLQATGRSLTDS